LSKQKEREAKAREVRIIELLKNASDCFQKCCSPFSLEELLKMDVMADECKDLSSIIGDFIDGYLEFGYKQDKKKKQFWLKQEEEE